MLTWPKAFGWCCQWIPAPHGLFNRGTRMAYDQKNVYILAICYKPLPQQDMVESLKRDFSFQKNDNFIFFIDTFNDQTSGYSFGSNAAGAEWDGTHVPGWECRFKLDKQMGVGCEEGLPR